MHHLAEREQRHAVRADLITLEAACALAFHHIYSCDPEGLFSTNTREARDAIAHALVVLTPVYTFNQDRSEIAQIDYGDLRGGRFLEGGRQLCFALANRTPITRLAIRASALRGAIDQLAGLRGVLDARRSIRICNRPRRSVNQGKQARRVDRLDYMQGAPNGTRPRPMLVKRVRRNRNHANIAQFWIAFYAAANLEAIETW